MGAVMAVVVGVFLASIVLFGVLLLIVLANDRDQLRGAPDVVVILGCRVKPWGPSVLLRNRLETALSYIDKHPGAVVVVSGGQGSDEHVSEAQAMRDYLVGRGVPAGSILLEARSTSTLENLLYSRDALQKAGYDFASGVLIVSNGFHMARVRMLWGRVCEGPGPLSTLAAPSSRELARVKMYIREPIALVKSFVFDRL